jgi:hypothetical protein
LLSQESTSNNSQKSNIANETIKSNDNIVVIMDENDEDSDENSNLCQNDRESVKSSSKSNDRLEIDESNNQNEPKQEKKPRNKKAFPCSKCDQVFYHYKQIRVSFLKFI